MTGILTLGAESKQMARSASQITQRVVFSGRKRVNKVVFKHPIPRQKRRVEALSCKHSTPTWGLEVSNHLCLFERLPLCLARLLLLLLLGRIVCGELARAGWYRYELCKKDHGENHARYGRLRRCYESRTCADVNATCRLREDVVQDG